VPAEAEALREAYTVVLEVREAVTKALEDARNGGVLGKSQEALLDITLPADKHAVLEARGAEALAEMFIVSAVKLSIGPDVQVQVGRADGEKCPRCWNWRDLGDSGLCARCEDVVGSH
jgi:isoleucyl-tRNA synthetase